MKWTKLKGLLANKISTISYAILIGLPLILHGFEAFNFKPKLSLSIILVFGAALLLFLAYLVYSAFVPDVLKSHKNMHDFLQQNADTIKRKTASQKADIVLAQLNNSQNQLKMEIERRLNEIESANASAKTQLESSLNIYLEEHHKGSIETHLQMVWNDSDTKEKRVPLFIGFFLAFLGIGLAVYLFVERVGYVIEYETSTM